MKQFIIIIICLLSCALSANCQVQVTPVFSGDNDSLVLKNLISLNFDSAGNYSAVSKYSDYYVLKRGVPLSSWTTLSDTFKYYEERKVENRTTQIFKHYEDRLQYCKFPNSNHLSRSYSDFMDISIAGNHIVVKTEDRHNSANTQLEVYVDDVLIGIIDTPYVVDFYGHNFCKASGNSSNLIYYTYAGKHFRLYVNKVVIDSSENIFEAISVNDKGKYAYMKSIKDKYYLVTSDTTIGPFNKPQYAKRPEGVIFNDGSYNYVIGDTSGDLHIINGKAQHIDLLDYGFSGNGHFYYFYKQDTAYQKIDYSSRYRYDGRHPSFYSYWNFDNYGRLKISESTCSLNLDGKVYETNYNHIAACRMDSAGNLDYYGVRNYYLYRNKNGKEADQPLSAYGVRPDIYSMAPNGSIIYIYTTTDSQYLYQDDNLLAKCKKGKRSIATFSGSDMGFEYGKSPAGLFGISVNGVSYIFYNGQIIYRDTLSAALDKVDYIEFEDVVTGVRGRSDSALLISHKIAKAGADGKNFFIIHESQNGKYRIFVNGKERGTLSKEEVQEINASPSATYYFQNEQLVLYGFRKGKTCRYKIDL